MRLGAAICALMIFVAGCASEDPGFSGDTRTVSDTVLTLRVEPWEVKLGFQSRFTLKVANSVAREQRLTFNSAEHVTFRVTRDGKTIWRSDATGEDTVIPALELLTYSVTFKPEQLGTYKVHAQLEAVGFEGELTADLEVED